MKRKKFVIALAGLIAVAAWVYFSLEPVREISRLSVYHGKAGLVYPVPSTDTAKKNVFIIADNNGTELFDLVAPYYLFSATGKANVSIVAKRKYPVALHKGFFVLPHYTFSEIDSLAIRPDVIVVPMLTAQGKDRPDSSYAEWIKSVYSADVFILSVCAGSFTAASTGLYDGKPMTTHASDMAANQKKNDHPNWVLNVTHTKSRNLYSTAGVSNAADGTLVLIHDLFGEEEAKRLMALIHYPHPGIMNDHQSRKVDGKTKMRILKKVLFKKDRNVGLLLNENIDEFMLAAVADSYNRSFPSKIRTYSFGDAQVKGKMGLTILPTGRIQDIKNVDELHVFSPQALPEALSSLRVVQYPDTSNYIFNITLERIKKMYGPGYSDVVKRLLDYN